MEVMREHLTMECGQNQTSNENSSEFWIRNQIGVKVLEDEYLLGDIIGRGISSTVYKCLRKGRTEWACKVLKKSALNKKSVQEEISTLLKIKHPNLVQLHEVFETENEIQLISEYARGGELFERIVEKEYYREEDAANSVKHVLNALRYLHHNGIIHGDLKPENLLYQTEFENSVLKLADYGMCKLMSDEYLAMNKSISTAVQCAPELSQNKPRDASVDLWNLGVVTYLMLCGFEPTWQQKAEETSCETFVQETCLFPSPWWDDISNSAKDFVSKLLSMDPKARPTAEEALAHPWFLETLTLSPPMKTTIVKLKEFNAKRSFRVATKAVIATRRALSFLPGRSPDRDGKTCSESLNKSATDVGSDNCSEPGEGVTCRGHVERSPTNEGKVVVNSLQALTIDRGGVEDKPPKKLVSDLPAQFKGNYVDLR